MNLNDLYDFFCKKIQPHQPREKEARPGLLSLFQKLKNLYPDSDPKNVHPF